MGRKPMGHAEDTLTSSIAQLVSHASTLTTLSGFARSAQRTVNADSSSRETAEPEKLAHATTRQSMLLPTRCARTESIEKISFDTGAINYLILSHWLFRIKSSLQTNTRFLYIFTNSFSNSGIPM